MKHTTLLFLVKRSGQDKKITDICLAMKKRGFGAGRWNGVGGKALPGESPAEAAIREAHEEIAISARAGDLTKVAEIEFVFPHNAEWHQLVHIYTTETWEGEPQESEEMRPQWYRVADGLPFDVMWPDDRFWVPLMLEDKLIKGRFSFGEGDIILEKRLETVSSL